jgi:hypothetical protein
MVNAIATTTAMTTPTQPALKSQTKTPLTATSNRTKNAIRTAERRLFCFTWSYSVRSRQNVTLTGPRDSSSASKNSRATKWKGPAISMFGKDWILVL